MKIVGVVQFHNEGSGNLLRCLDSMSKHCDEIVCFDDGSTDNSLEIAKQFTKQLIINPENDFKNEIYHKEALLTRALSLRPDWIFWIDADEVVAENGNIREQCEIGDKKGFDGFMFHEVNLWKSLRWYRIDSQFGEGWFFRLWKNNGNLHYEPHEGLHQPSFPLGMTNPQYSPIKIIHYGFSTKEKIIQKYKMYLEHGMTTSVLRRFIFEQNLQFESVKKEWFPNGGINLDEKQPEQIKEEEWLRLINQK